MNSIYSAFVGIIFLSTTIFLAPPSFQNTQSAKCDGRDLQAAIQSSEQVYSMAMELADRLQAKDFTIKCVLRSKMEGLFEGLQGAALFRTNKGDFEALFLPKHRTFEKLNVLERHDTGWYIYSFDGDPKPWPANRIESPRRMYFVKQAHILLSMSSDTLAKDLHTAIIGQ